MNRLMFDAQGFKAAVAGITKEYFQSADAADAAASLKSLDDEEHHDVFVKQVAARTYVVLYASSIVYNDSEALLQAKMSQLITKNGP